MIWLCFDEETTSDFLSFFSIFYNSEFDTSLKGQPTSTFNWLCKNVHHTILANYIFHISLDFSSHDFSYFISSFSVPCKYQFESWKLFILKKYINYIKESDIKNNTKFRNDAREKTSSYHTFDELHSSTPATVTFHRCLQPFGCRPN